MREERRWRKGVGMALLFALLLPTLAMALQVSPAAHTAHYGAIEYPLRIINNENRALSVTIQADPLVTVTPTALTVAPNTEKEVWVRYTGEEEDLEPGDNTLPVIVTRAVDADGQFGAGVALAHKLIVTRLYDGAFIDGELYAVGEKVVMLLRNKGRAATEVEGQLLLGPAERAVKAGVAGSTSRRLEHELPPLPRGAYEARAVLTYNDGAEERRLALQERFAIGEPEVTLGRPSANLVEGRIAEVTVPVSVDWNTPLEAYAVLQLRRGETVVAQEATSTEVLAESITGFIDAPEPGAYELRVSLHSRNGDRLTAKSWNVTVQARAEAEPDERSTQQWPARLAIIGGILIALTIVAALLWRRATTRQ